MPTPAEMGKAPEPTPEPVLEESEEEELTEGKSWEKEGKTYRVLQSKTREDGTKEITLEVTDKGKGKKVLLRYDAKRRAVIGETYKPEETIRLKGTDEDGNEREITVTVVLESFADERGQFSPGSKIRFDDGSTKE